MYRTVDELFGQLLCCRNVWSKLILAELNKKKNTLIYLDLNFLLGASWFEAPDIWQMKFRLCRKHIAWGASQSRHYRSKSYGFNIMQWLCESLAQYMLMICTPCCWKVVQNPLWRFQFWVPVSSWCSGLDVPLEFLDAEVTVMVQFGERLPHPQGCQAGRWALVPTLLHNLRNGRQDLDTRRQM